MKEIMAIISPKNGTKTKEVLDSSRIPCNECCKGNGKR